MGSQEFEYLRESFNQMSERLKYQFDHIYEEELASAMLGLWRFSPY